jgi:hypothetical protein
MKWTSRDIPLRRLASVAIAVGPIFALFAVLGAVYLVKWSAFSDEIEARGLEITKVGWIADNAERLGADIAATEQSLSSDSVLGNADPDTAAGELQKNVKALLDAATMQISSIQPVAVSEEDGIRFVSVRAQASGTYDTALAFLQSAYRATPPVLIGAVDLMPDPTQQSTSGDTGAVRYLLQFEAIRLMAAGQ